MKQTKKSANTSKLLYILKIKLKDQQSINLEIHEGENISEVVKTTIQSNKLITSDLQEALQVHVQRKMEAIIVSSGAESDNKKVSEKSQSFVKQNHQNNS